MRTPVEPGKVRPVCSAGLAGRRCGMRNNVALDRSDIAAVKNKVALKATSKNSHLNYITKEVIKKMPEKINILELSHGAIAEQISNELGKVLANLVDPNTDVKTKRKLTVTLEFKPDENRDVVECSAQASCTLAKVKPITTKLLMDTDHLGRPVAAEFNRDKGSALAEEIDTELKLIKSVS